MVRLYFYVEGQTEQGYVKQVLTPHLAGFGVQVMGAVLAASGRKHGHVSRGGGRRLHHTGLVRDLHTATNVFCRAAVNWVAPNIALDLPAGGDDVAVRIQVR